MINTENGLLNIAEFIPSPNHNERPTNTLIDLLVIHNISLPPGEFQGEDVIALFLNQLNCQKHPYYERLIDLKVSTHLFIRRNGEVTQFVPFHLRAWHAGESLFGDRPNCNDYSIGIELEGTDELPYTSNQYEILSQITVWLRRVYPGISFDRIVGHQTIAPTRKTDPGLAFDWDYYFKLIRAKEVA